MMDDTTKMALMNHLQNDVTYPAKGSDVKMACDNWSDVPGTDAERNMLEDEKMYNSAEEVMMAVTKDDMKSM